MARRPSRPPTGLGRSSPRFGGSGPCIVKVEHQFSFAFLDKWITLRSVFLITKLLRCYCLGAGAVAIAAIAYNSLAPEEGRHTWR
jgi:hypothetical protein